MGQLTNYTVTAGSDIVSDTASGLWDMLWEIAYAHNLHATGDFGTDDIPLEAVVTNKDRFVFCLTNTGTLTGPIVSGTVQAYFVIPFVCDIIGGWVTASAVAAGQRVFLRREGTTTATAFNFSGANLTSYEKTTDDEEIFNPVTPVASHTTFLGVDAGSPLIQKMKAGDILSMRMVVASALVSSNVIYTVAAKAFHTTV